MSDAPLRSILVNALPSAWRIAVTEAGRLVRYQHVDHGANWRIGQVYLGRVSQVLPAIDACFVDVGQTTPVFVNRRQIPDDGDKTRPIQSLVKVGTAMRVQITKGPIDGKNPQASGTFKSGGFYLSLSQGSGQVRFSGHFDGDREGPRQLLSGEPFNRFAWRVRAAASHRDPGTLAAEAQRLAARAAALLDAPLEGPNRLLDSPFPLDDILLDEPPCQLRAIYCDDDEVFALARDRYGAGDPTLAAKFQRHHGPLPLFDTYKVTSALDSLCADRVWLKSGGSLLFHQSDAMVTVDVNSGKLRKGKQNRSAHLTTNLEAVAELFYQIRLRNLAGLIAVDFLNLPHAGERKQLQAAIAQHAAEDRAELDLEPVNRLGVLVMARQRRGEDFERRHKQTCPQCHGSGRIATAEVVALRLQQELMRDGESYRGEHLHIEAGALLYPYLRQHEQLLFSNLAENKGFTYKLVRAAKKTGVGYRLILS